MPSHSDDSDAKERGADTIIDKDINRDVNKNVARDRDRNFFMGRGTSLIRRYTYHVAIYFKRTDAFSFINGYFLAFRFCTHVSFCLHHN